MGNKTFDDIGKNGDWIAPQAKTLVVFPSDSKAIEAKIKNNQKLYFRKTSSKKNIKPDFRLQQEQDIGLIFKIISLVNEKMKTNISEKLKKNYQKFLREANEFLDEKLKRKNPKLYLKKAINTDYQTYQQEYISMIEGKNDPIYGFQFHIEKSMYNFHKNRSVKNNMIPRLKDQMLAKFFLFKVFSHKLECLKKGNLGENSVKNGINTISWILENNFTHNHFVPHKRDANSKTLSSFNFKWLDNGISSYTNSKNKIVQSGYNMNSEYYNNTSEQIIRDYDEFYGEILKGEKDCRVFGSRDRFVLRKIGTEAEALIYKRMDLLDQSRVYSYAQKNKK
jgi:hypothetical protein